MPLRIKGAWPGRGHCPLPYGPILSRRSVGACPKCHTSRAWQGRDYHPLPCLPDRSTCCRGWGALRPCRSLRRCCTRCISHMLRPPLCTHRYNARQNKADRDKTDREQQQTNRKKKTETKFCVPSARPRTITPQLWSCSL